MSNYSVDQLSAEWRPCGAPCVAVYGTLRAGGVNDMVRLRAGITPVGQTLLRGTLYDLGWYPGLRLTGQQAVLAEVYPIDDALEQALDGIEGLWPEDVGEYTKQIVRLPVRQTDGKIVAMDVLLYEAVAGTVANCPVIAAPEGGEHPLDWLHWQASHARVHPDTAFTLRSRT